MKKLSIVALGCMLSFGILQSCQSSTSSATGSTDNIDSLKKIAMQYVASHDTVASQLKTFDEPDFDVFSNQKWDRLKESHAKDIKVYWPDGHIAVGIDQHLEDLKKLFVHAPDTRIKDIPLHSAQPIIPW